MRGSTVDILGHCCSLNDWQYLIPTKVFLTFIKINGMPSIRTYTLIGSGSG